MHVKTSGNYLPIVLKVLVIARYMLLLLWFFAGMSAHAIKYW
jgi:hypothetical protein